MKPRRRAALLLDEAARHLGKLADRLDPPRPVLDRAEAAASITAADRQAARDRHPSTGVEVPRLTRPRPFHRGGGYLSSGRVITELPRAPRGPAPGGRRLDLPQEPRP
jgi:hypothetical protein